MEQIIGAIAGAQQFLTGVEKVIFMMIAFLLQLIGIGSLIVKITPTLKDDDSMKSFIRFVGRYIALDKYGPNGEVGAPPAAKP